MNEKNNQINMLCDKLVDADKKIKELEYENKELKKFNKSYKQLLLESKKENTKEEYDILKKILDFVDDMFMEESDGNYGLAKESKRIIRQYRNKYFEWEAKQEKK